MIEGLLIEKFANEGKGLGRVEGKAIFVKRAIPGDVVNVFLEKNRKDYAVGRVLKFVKASELRSSAKCKHYGICGGCTYQDVDYQQQLAFKTQFVQDAFERIAMQKEGNILPIMGSDKIYNYRNKLEFTFSNLKWLTKEQVDSEEEISEMRALGFHVPGNFYKIVQIDECHLQSSPSNEIRNFIYQLAIKEDLEFYDIRKHTGLLRNLIIRISKINELMVIVAFAKNEADIIASFMEKVKLEFPSINSLNYVVNEKLNDTLFDQEIICFSGKPYIEEELGHIRYEVGPKSFFQTNSLQAEKLYEQVRLFAELSGNENVYDLYTGIGSIALYLAENCKSIIGIEQVEAAIIDAEKNAVKNNISNAKFYAGETRKVLTDSFIEEHGKVDVLVTDPPRAGMHKEVIESILKIGPERIVYVSCNPSTQARDIALLSEDYEFIKCQPVDMFPHTPHIENIALLRKRK